MKKTDKKQAKDTGRGAIEWPPLRDLAEDALDWALDIAAKLADDRDETEAVESVREFMHARINDEPTSVRVDDLMFTLALVFGAVDHELGLDGIPQQVLAQVAALVGPGRVGGAPRVLQVPPRRPPTPTAPCARMQVCPVATALGACPLTRIAA